MKLSITDKKVQQEFGYDSALVAGLKLRKLKLKQLC